jgi:hypothetical protein
MSYLERAIADGHAKLTGENKQQKILYVAVNHTERYADPEEQVRAEFNQAVEQACGNGTWAKFRANYVGVVAGMTRTWVGTVRCAVRCSWLIYCNSIAASQLATKQPSSLRKYSLQWDDPATVEIGV